MVLVAVLELEPRSTQRAQSFLIFSLQFMVFSALKSRITPNLKAGH
jgi:hypothetical protein